MPNELTLAKAERLTVLGEMDLSHKAITLRVVGFIEAEAPLETTGDFLLNQRNALTTVLIDTRGVTRINSRGVRSWLDFIKRVQEFPFQYSFSYLNEIFIDQANGFPNLLGREGTPVLSFEAPYLCRNCDIRSIRVLETKNFDLTKRSWSAPIFYCEKCSLLLEFDEQESNYFRFLARLTGRPTPKKTR